MAVPTISPKQRRKINKAIGRSETNKKLSTSRNSLRERVYWLFMIGIILLILVMLIMVSIYDLPINIPDLVPFNLHSVLVADYSADPKAELFPALHIDLVRDVIYDSGTPNAQDPFSIFKLGLLTPVSTVTPLHTIEGTQLTTNTPATTPTSTVPAPGETRQPASDPTQTPTIIPTNLLSTPTGTQAFVPSNTPPRPTNQPPTKTRLPSTSKPTKTQPPPATKVPPTPTPRPPNPTDPPTPTPRPPNPTDTPDPYPPYP